jgi:hypothetical protein
MAKRYRLKGKVWLWPGEVAAWHFVHLEKKLAGQLKEKYGRQNAWSSIRVKVGIGRTTWQTSIFWDTRSGTYLLPLKAQVRRAEGIIADDEIIFTLEVQ